jgi:hypothetical protein
MLLKDFAPQAPNAKWGAHVMCWFDNKGENNHISPGYASTDLAVISRQADLMQSVGISWINIDFYQNETTTLNAAKAWLKECEHRGMEFSLCMDGDSKTSTSAMSSALQAASWAFQSLAYKRSLTGQLEVSDYDAQGIDWIALQAQFPNIKFLHLHSGYAWVEITADAVGNIKSQNSQIGANGWQGVFAGFHDFNWGKGPERFVDYRNGQTFKDTCATITPNCRNVFVITWNDHDERTGIERNLDEATGSPTITQWPPPDTGKYQWPLPLGGIFGSGADPQPAPSPVPLNYTDNIKAASGYLDKQQLKDGAILYGSIIHPYFGNIAARGWLRDPNKDANVLKWLMWYVAHLNVSDYWGSNSAGTIYDYDTANGVTMAPVMEANTSHPHADSIDSYAATFLTLCADCWNTEDSALQGWITANKRALDNVAAAIYAVLDPTDGMTVAKPDYPQKYLMDNSEVCQGLKAYGQLCADLGDGSGHTKHLLAAQKINLAIRGMWDGARLPVSKGGPAPTLSKFYPDAIAQLYPILCGVVTPNDPIAKIAYEGFVTAVPDFAALSYMPPQPFPSAEIGMAAWLMGDTDNTNKFIESLVSRYQSQGFSWPWYCAENGWYMMLNSAIIDSNQPSPSPAPGGDKMRVILVPLENTNYVDVQPNMPYLWGQAQKYDLKSNYFANVHPSMGDYLMLTTGRADSTDDGFNGTIADPTIVSVLAKSGKTAVAYAEGLSSGQNFYKRHVPFLYFASKPPVKDLSALAFDLASGQLADFVMITPNGVNDGHDGSLQQCDSWLKANIDNLFNLPNTYVIVVFDESKNDNTQGGGKVFAMEGGTLARKGFNDNTPWNHRDMYNHIVQLVTSGTPPTPAPPSTTVVTISPQSAKISPGSPQQFVATVTGPSDRSVTWMVNGVAGGLAATGLISASGMYVAPNSQTGTTVTVAAKSNADPSAIASATVAITAPPTPIPVPLGRRKMERRKIIP